MHRLGRFACVRGPGQRRQGVLQSAARLLVKCHVHSIVFVPFLVPVALTRSCSFSAPAVRTQQARGVAQAAAAVRRSSPAGGPSTGKHSGRSRHTRRSRAARPAAALLAVVQQAVLERRGAAAAVCGACCADCVHNSLPAARSVNRWCPHTLSCPYSASTHMQFSYQLCLHMFP